MLKLKSGIVVLGMMLFVGLAQAAPITFGLQGGVSIPMSDYGDFVKLGPQGGVFADYWVKDEFGLGADIVGNFHKGKDDLITELEDAGFTNPELSFTAIQFGVHGKWMPKMTGQIAPWLGVGVGMYNGKTTFKGSFSGVSFDEDDSSSKFGVNASGGVNFKASEMWGVGVMASFHNVTDAIDQIDPNTGESAGTKSAQYVSVGATVTFATTGTSK
jgi:opacity protein-like surface antigen